MSKKVLIANRGEIAVRIIRACKALVEEYRQTFANPYVAASYGYVDDVIEPHQTRPKLISALEMVQNKRDTNPPKKHGNIPL